jgi:hypothetical protein
MVSPKNGVFESRGVRSFAKVYAATSGATDEVLASIDVKSTKGTLELWVGNKNVATVPRKAGSGAKELKAIRDIISGLRDALPRKGLLQKAKALTFIDSYQKSLAKQNIFTPAWVENAIRNKGGELVENAEGTLDMVVNGKTFRTFDAMDRVGEFLVRENVSEEALTEYFRTKGITLKREASGRVTASSSEMKPTSFDTMDAFFDRNPELLPKIPSSLAPEIVITQGKPGIKYTGNVLLGGSQDAYKQLDNFMDYEDLAFKRVVGGTGGKIAWDRVTRQYAAYVPDIEYTRTFNSLGEAQAFLRKGWRDFEELKRIAMEKAYALTPWEGHWALYSADGKMIHVRNSADLATELKKIPMGGFAPELSGMKGNWKSLDTVNTRAFTFQTDQYATKVKSKWLVASMKWRTPESVFRRVSEGYGQKSFLQFYDNIEAARRNMRGIEATTQETLRGTLLDSSGLQMVPTRRRKGILHLRRAIPDEVDEIVKNYRLRPSDVQDVAGRLDDFVSLEGGLWDTFDMRPNELIDEVLPKVKKHHLENMVGKRSYTDGDLGLFLDEAYGGKAPEHVKRFFGRSARLSDVLNLAMQEDPYAILTKYITMGNRKAFLTPSLEDAWKWYDTHGAEVDQTILLRMRSYLSDVAGVPQGLNEELAVSFQKQLDSVFGIRRTAKARLLDIKKIMSLGYMASLGWRVWLPIRNSFQIWTTLAPRIGNTWVADSVSRIARDQGNIIADARRAGILQSLPVFGGEEAAFQKALKTSLSMFRSSDDYTRVIAWDASKRRFYSAVPDYLAGKIDEAAFVNVSGLSNLDPLRRNQAMSLVAQKSDDAIEIAQKMFSTQMVEETMFPYRSGLGPTTFRGTFGKMFGMLGNYSLYYTENIRKALKYLSGPQKAAFAARWIANTSAIYFAFKEVFGIREMGFLPHMPMIFTGGPYFNLTNNLLTAMNFRSYEGRQKRAEVFGFRVRDGKLSIDFESIRKTELAKWIVPGSFMLQSLERAIEYFNQGDTVRAFLSLTSAPVNPEQFFLQDLF